MQSLSARKRVVTIWPDISRQATTGNQIVVKGFKTEKPQLFSALNGVELCSLAQSREAALCYNVIFNKNWFRATVYVPIKTRYNSNEVHEAEGQDNAMRRTTDLMLQKTKTDSGVMTLKYTTLPVMCTLKLLNLW